MKQKIIDKIKSSESADKTKSDIINSLTDRYLIEAYKAKINLGDSKIGGFPHLPKEFEYPQQETYYYEFVGQINLFDLKDNEIPDFPTKGIMYFFIDDDFNVGNINTKVFVLDSDTSELEIKRPPQNKKSRCEAFLNRTENSELKLLVSKSYTIEQNLLDKIVDEQLINKNPNFDFDIEQFYTKDQIWGFTTTWGITDADWSAYLAKKRLQGLYWWTQESQIEYLKKEKIDFRVWLKNKVDDAILKQKEILLKNDKSAHIYPYWEKELIDLEYTKLNLDAFIDNFEYHKSKSKKWKMLFSLSSYYDAEIKFGDGKMEFYINMDDLKNQNFDNIYCHIYN